jgi:hypothetical protein
MTRHDTSSLLRDSYALAPSAAPPFAVQVEFRSGKPDLMMFRDEEMAHRVATTMTLCEGGLKDHSEGARIQIEDGNGSRETAFKRRF